MISICIDCRMWGKTYGGIGRYTKEIVLYLLNHENWLYTLLCYKNTYEELSEFLNSSSKSNIQLCLCKAPLFSLKAQLDFVLNVPECDILWVPSINIPILPVRAKYLVTTIHDLFHLAHPEYYSKTKLSILKFLIGRAVRKSTLIFTVSDFSAGEIARFYGQSVANKVHRVYNGYTPVNCNYDKCEIESRYILYVGNIKPHKNLKNALLGYEQYIKNTGDKLDFIIVGKKEGFVTSDKDIESIVKRFSKNKNKIVFAGNVDDEQLYKLYKFAALFIQPSYYEGFGIPLIEAMSFATPIICSEIAVFKEICGNQVTYFNPHEPYSISQAISDSINKGKCSYSTWQSWDDTGKEVSELLKNLIVE